MLSLERIQGGAQHAISGGATKPGINPKGGLLFDRLSTRQEIIGVEISAKQRFQVHCFEFLDQIPVLDDSRGNVRQFRRDVENGLDRLVEMGRNRWPYFLDGASGLGVKVVKLIPKLNPMDQFALRHGLRNPDLFFGENRRFLSYHTMVVPILTPKKPFGRPKSEHHRYRHAITILRALKIGRDSRCREIFECRLGAEITQIAVVQCVD